MERKISLNVASYISKFKEDIKMKMFQLQLLDETTLHDEKLLNDKIEEKLDQTDSLNQNMCYILLQYIYDYDNFEITKDLLEKKNRKIKQINYNNRCCALKMDGNRCSRSKRDNSDYCGTHNKINIQHTQAIQTPQSQIQEALPQCDTSAVDNDKIELKMIEVEGIVHYIDSENNIYRMEDILSKNTNPAKIGRID